MKNKLLVTLLSSLLVAGCAVATPMAVKAVSEANAYIINDKTRTIPPYTPSEPTNPKQITSVEIVDMPENNVLNIGEFDDYGIGYKVHYSDDSSDEKVTLQFDDLPVPLKEIMSVEGDHNVALQIKGAKTNFPFTNNDSGLRYTTTFKNYNGTTLESDQVIPYSHPVYDGETPRRPRSGMVKFNFAGWDKDLKTTYVKENMDFVAQYDMVTENNDYVGVVGNQIHVADLVEPGSMTGKFALYYAGRMNNVPIQRDYADIVHHTKGSTEHLNYGFDSSDMPDLDDPVKRQELYDNIGVPFNTSYSYNTEDLDPAITDIHYKQINTTFIPNTKYFKDFEFEPMEVTNILDQTYTTTTNDFESYVIDMYENGNLDVDVYIPEELETGDYCPTVYLDIDLYLYVYLYETPVGTDYGAVISIPSPCAYRADVGIVEELPSKTTSTDLEDYMNIAVGEMFTHCKNIGNE